MPSPAPPSAPPGPVAAIGVHIVDILARPIDHIPDGQGTALVEQIRVTAAGSAAGTAVDLVKLGVHPVTCHGAIGDDELGDLLLAVLGRHGVDTTGLARRTGGQTAASILPIRPDGGRPSFHVPGENLSVTPADVDPGAVLGARAVRLGGMDVTFALNDPGFFDLLDRARAGGTVVTMDLLSEMADLLVAAKAFLPHVDYVLPNLSQALAMTGAADAEGAARALLVQRASEIPWEEIGEVSVLGLSAGASAPEIIVEEIIDAFAERYDVTVDLAVTAEERENFPVMRALRDVELTKSDMAFVNGMG